MAELTNSQFNKEFFSKTTAVCVKFMAATSARGTFLSLLLQLHSAPVPQKPCSNQMSLPASSVCRISYLEARFEGNRLTQFKSSSSREVPDQPFENDSDTRDCLSRFDGQPPHIPSQLTAAALIAVLADRKTNVPYVAGVTVFSCLMHQQQRSTLIIGLRSSVRLEFALESNERICGPR